MVFTAIVGIFCVTMITGGLYFLGRKLTDHTGPITNSTIGEARWNSHSSVVELEIDKVFDLSGRSEIFEISIVIMIIMCLCVGPTLIAFCNKGMKTFRKRVGHPRQYSKKERRAEKRRIKLKKKKIQEEIDIKRREDFLQRWRENKRRKWMLKHRECCLAEEEMAELERRRGSRVGRLTKEKMTKVRFEDERKHSEEDKSEEQVAVMIHGEGQESGKNCKEEEGEAEILKEESSMEAGRAESSILVEGESGKPGESDEEGEEEEEEDEEEEEEEMGRERRYETDSSVTVDGESVFTEV